MKTIISSLFILVSSFVFGQIPILNSNVAASAKVIYLDFDGQVVTGTNWNSAFSIPSINALPSTISSAGMTEVWKRVAEDFIPFDVNVTTDVTKYNAATANTRIRVIITPTSLWYSASSGTLGVAYLNSFSWGNNTPVWVFENNCSYIPKSIAETASHETGHSLSLGHQSIYNLSTCVKINDYHPGQGSGVTSWSPIMGNGGFTKNVSIWDNGTGTGTCAINQFDHTPGPTNSITKPGMLNYKTDDVGDTYTTSKLLNLTTNHLIDSGIISQPTEIDVYQFSLCNSRYVTFNIRPFALDTISYDGVDLDVNFKLYNAANNLLLTIAPIASLNCLGAMNLTAGNYYFTIDGDGSANYSDYGSLGRYYMDIYSNNVPTLVSAFSCISTACIGQAFTATDLSSGSPNNWNWNVAGPTNTTSASQNPTFSFNNPGTYTVTLAASNGTSASCPVSKIITIYGNPTISLALNPSTVCANITSTLSATGANSYTWLPTPVYSPINYSSVPVYSVSSVVFTVTGNSFGCTSSNTILLTVLPLPTITVVSNPTTICSGQSVTLTASGATTYTWMSSFPTNTTSYGNPLVETPTVSSLSYTMGGTGANGCKNWTNKFFIVNPSPTVTPSSTPTLACAGQPFTLTATGATAYTWTPGPLTGSNVVVTPTANTIYTLSGSNGTCASSAPITISVTPNPTVNVNSLSICIGSSVSIVATGATTYSWSTTSTSNSINVTPIVTTTYTVTGTTGSCSSTKTSTITVDVNPTITVNSSSVCSGNPVNLIASGATTYSWNTSSTSNSIAVSPTSTTVYTVTGNNGACSVTKTSTVTVVNLPTVSINSSASVTCVNGSTVTLSGTPSGGIFSGVGVVGSSFVSPATAGNYQVVYSFTDAATGCSNTNSITIVVSPCTKLDENSASDAVLFVYPNPNEGKFFVEINKLTENGKVEVYNTLGQLVISQIISQNRTVINVGENAPGIYILKINVGNSKAITKRVVVSN